MSQITTAIESYFLEHTLFLKRLGTKKTGYGFGILLIIMDNKTLTTINNNIWKSLQLYHKTTATTTNSKILKIGLLLKGGADGLRRRKSM